MKHPRPLPPPVEELASTALCDETGKIRFSSRAQATRQRSARRNKGARMRAYYCASCHGWHLTASKSARPA